MESRSACVVVMNRCIRFELSHRERSFVVTPCCRKTKRQGRHPYSRTGSGDSAKALAWDEATIFAFKIRARHLLVPYATRLKPSASKRSQSAEDLSRTNQAFTS